MKKYSQFLNFFKFSKGFTLIELLIAMSITLVVITLAGSGLVVIMNADQKAAIATDRRTNLNRALDFIADEIREASRVSAVPSGSTFPGSGTGVLLITVPPTTAPNANKVYFVRPTATNWASPNTINIASGSYSTASAVTVSSTVPPVDSMLVDGVADVKYPISTCTSGYTITVTKGTTTTSACLPAVDAPTCPSGSTLTPAVPTGSSTVTSGFFACIGSDKRTVDLYLYGQVSDTNPNQYTVVKTKVFARNQ